jgi:hypothetical protein
VSAYSNTVRPGGTNYTYRVREWVRRVSRARPCVECPSTPAQVHAQDNTLTHSRQDGDGRQRTDGQFDALKLKMEYRVPFGVRCISPGPDSSKWQEADWETTPSETWLERRET